MLLARVLIIVAIGEFAQRFDQVCNLYHAVCIGRPLEHQEQPGSVCKVSLGRVPQSIVADLVKTTRQDVLEKTPQELDAGQPDGSPRVGASILRAEHHVGVVHAENPCLTDRDPEYIP